jgi:shikimate kinase
MDEEMTIPNQNENIELVRSQLGQRSITIVGLMGAGKSVIGRKVAMKLKIPFVDADSEIEKAAKMTVADIFSSYGEPEFRRLEKSVIKRVLENGPQILATGGGAYMDPETQQMVSDSGISLWLSADIDLLMQRVSKKTTRPLLKKPNPRGVMEDLMRERYPVYALADVEIASRDVSKDEMTNLVIAGLAQYFREQLPANMSDGINAI